MLKKLFLSILFLNFLYYQILRWEHWFIKNLVGTWRRNDVDATSLRRIDVVTTTCACWEFAPPPPWPPQYSKPCPPPPPPPPNILNLPTLMTRTYCKCSRPLPYSNPNKQDAPALEVYQAPSHHPTTPAKQGESDQRHIVVAFANAILTFN